MTSVTLTLVGSFLRSGGRSRALLVASCAAIVAGLLLVAVAVAQVGSAGGYRVVEDGGVATYPGREVFGNLVADPGVRGGYVFALVLICIAPLALLAQAVRLGTASREVRLAALRVAGATTRDVRRIGAVEVGLPALVGGVAGYLVYLVLRGLFGGLPESRGAVSGLVRETRLVPTTITPSWWQVLLVAVGVGLLGVLVGALATRRVLVSPLGVTRRTAGRPPRPWGLLALALAAVLLGVEVSAGGGEDVVGMVMVLAAVLGVLSLAPWCAYRLGLLVSARATCAPVLIAARRLTTDPRSVGRAAASVGAIALTASVAGSLMVDAIQGASANGYTVEAMYAVPTALVGVVLVVALVLVMFALTVHGVENAADRRRSLASLSALGLPVDALERVQRWESGLVALPMAVGGVALGSVPALALVDGGTAALWLVPAVDVVTVGLVGLAVLGSARLTRPWLRRASAPENLRTA